MKNEYKTFADQYYLEDAGFLERLVRDIRLLRFLLTTIVMWIKTRKVRLEYQRCRATGEPFYVDRFTPPGQNK